MKGALYNSTASAVQTSFGYVSHENLSIADGVADTSVAISATNVVFLSLLVGAHVRIGSGDADTNDMALPPGIWPLLTRRGQTISVIGLSGGNNGQASIIFVEE